MYHMVCCMSILIYYNQWWNLLICLVQTATTEACLCTDHWFLDGCGSSSWLRVSMMQAALPSPHTVVINIIVPAGTCLVMLLSGNCSGKQWSLLKVFHNMPWFIGHILTMISMWTWNYLLLYIWILCVVWRINGYVTEQFCFLKFNGYLKSLMVLG